MIEKESFDVVETELEGNVSEVVSEGLLRATVKYFFNAFSARRGLMSPATTK